MSAVFTYTTGVDVRYHTGIFTHKKTGCLSAGAAVGLTIFGMGVLSYLQVINLSHAAFYASLVTGSVVMGIECGYALWQYRKYAKIRDFFEEYLDSAQEDSFWDENWDLHRTNYLKENVDGYDYWDDTTFNEKRMFEILEIKKDQFTLHIFPYEQKLEFLKLKDFLLAKDFRYISSRSR